MAWQSGDCIQDQYGNQYTLQIDTTHQYITGTVSGGQGGSWILTGSYVQSAPGDNWIYELTASNTQGTSAPGFVPVYKLKGVQPDGAWYYQSGYGGQEFTFTACTKAAVASEKGLEPLKKGESRGSRMG